MKLRKESLNFGVECAEGGDHGSFTVYRVAGRGDPGACHTERGFAVVRSGARASSAFVQVHRVVSIGTGAVDPPAEVDRGAGDAHDAVLLGRVHGAQFHLCFLCRALSVGGGRQAGVKRISPGCGEEDLHFPGRG